jgi:hypothetical protein
MAVSLQPAATRLIESKVYRKDITVVGIMCGDWWRVLYSIGSLRKYPAKIN